MSMEKKRDDIGKLLACLLVSRKGVSTIRDLERDYRENEGRNIPYREYGCLSLLDFFRSISNHIRIVSGNGTYLVYPVVSEKIKHVNELVSRQRPAKRNHTPVRRRPNRYSQYYPPVREPKPFVPHTVQKEIAKILTTNKSGVDKSYIAQCLDKSKEVAGTVDSDNVDDYLTGMPYTAVGKGSRVYASRALSAGLDTTRRDSSADTVDIDGFEVVSPNSKTTKINNQVMNEYPAGEEEDEYYDEDTEFTQPSFSNMNNHHPPDGEYHAQQSSKRTDENKPRMSSAEFIHKAAGSQYDEYSRYKTFEETSHHWEENRKRGVKVEDLGEDVEAEGNYMNNGDCTFESDDDGSIDVINERLKSRLQRLIQKNPDGIWCANLLQTFLDEFKVPLEYAELGFGSVCQLASSLPKIFTIHRQDSRGDFILYDATKPLPPLANKPEPKAPSAAWENDYYDDDVDPFPRELPLASSRCLVPPGVMTHGETVGQERIPDIIPGDECLEVYVVEVYTPSLFWVHLRKKRSKLSQLMETMNDFYQQKGDNYTIPPIILEKGLNCVCTFEDKWHRAIIKTVNPNGNVTLILYDYGTIKTYHPNDLRFLVRTYSNLPAQGIAAGLYNVKPINANLWTRGASMEFYNKVADLPLMAMVIKVDRENNSMLVSLVDTQHEDDEHINDWMVKEGYAETGFMGDTVVEEFTYLDDEKSPAPTKLQPDSVPLVSPGQICNSLPEFSGSTLKPPPGLTKSMEPMNVAAFMDECLQRKDNNPTQMGNLFSSNFCNGNTSNNTFAASNSMYMQAPEIHPMDPLFELWKQHLVIVVMNAGKQVVYSPGTSPSSDNTVPNSSSTEMPPTTSFNPTVEKSPTNPFRSLNQEEITTETFNVASSLGRSMDGLKNLDLNDSNRFNVHNSTNLADVSTRETPFFECGGNTSFLNKPFEESGVDKNKSSVAEDYESFEKGFMNKAQTEISQENFFGKSKEVTAQELHDTNPFKQHIAKGVNTRVNSDSKEQSLPDLRPPIPPRNAKFINKSDNLNAKQTADVTPNALPVNNNLQKTPTAKIYYKGDPVSYNSREEKTSEIKSKPDNVTTNLTDSVSPGGNNPFNNVDLSKYTTNHPLSSNTTLNFETTNTLGGYSNSLESGGFPRFGNPQTNNSFTQSTMPQSNQTQGLSPRGLTNSYRPPPPPYNENKTTEYIHKNKPTLSPRFTSPILSDNSKAALEEIQTNFFDKLESLATGKSLQDLGTSEEQEALPSFDTNHNTIPAKTTSSSNTAKSSTPYKIHFNIPKFLQGQESSVNLKQEEESNASYQTIKQEQSTPITEPNDPTPTQSAEHQVLSKNSEKSELWKNTFEAVPDNRTRLDTKEKNNASASPTLHSQQSSVNEQHLFKKEPGVAFGLDISQDKNSLKFPNTRPENTLPSNVSYSYQPSSPIAAQLYPQLPQAPNYQYHLPQPNWMQNHHLSPRPALFRPNVHGFYPPGLPHWQRPQVSNPAYFYPPHNAPPLVQHAHLWNNYNSHIFRQPQVPYQSRPAVPNSQPTCKIDISKDSFLPESNHTQQTKLGKENTENDVAVQGEETLIEASELINETTDQAIAYDTSNSQDCYLSTQLDTSNTSAANENVPNHDTEEFVEKDTTSKQETNGSQISPLNDYSGKSVNGDGENIPQCASPQILTNVFKTVEVNKQTMYIFNIQNEGWACTDEIALTFTPYESHDIILRCLEIARVQIEFKEVSRAQSPLLFAELDGTTIRLPRMKNSKRIKGTLHLTPLRSLIIMMYYLKLVSPEEIISYHMHSLKQLPPGSKIPELLKLTAAFRSDDQYWVA